MKSLMLVFALGTAAPTATPMAHALQDTAEAPSARVLNDIAYYDGADADPERHALNLVLPADGAARATVLWIHGGAWAAGGRADEMGLAQALAAEGIAVAVMSYRLSPGRWMSENLPDTGVQHPAHIEDVARAFAWLWTHAPEHGLDRETLFVSGFSAGGHLSALLATDERYLIAEGLSDDAIRGAIPVGGTYDVEHYFRMINDGLGAQAAQDHVVGVFGPRPGHAAASPASYLEQSDTPMLVISEGQSVIYADHFQSLVDASSMRDLVRFEAFNEETHASLYYEMIEPDAPSPARTLMLEFIDQQLAD
ncbi:MAG: alpha/beta hydrolase [Maricaulis sp.]|uniref:alpha/beta hydrolase n=1 Tax=Maricaulis sp. TaxID=1486257 RepID=UPI001B080D7C|nr:alpha/beta hydrolase [Maricaulis sp.]MBO6730802.1 alpha/beta hydrolase [Maricaulis sp.]MBO6848036.1 alpha/beta hydrolase [Maricaulis sp.]MBO6878061.1 alpha/beta hydrolase [Maricaulis sp.]